VNEGEDAEEGEGPKILSKKEKERLKKEKEKVDYILSASLNSPHGASSFRQRKRPKRLRRRLNPPNLRRQ
jgi:hypothetical protein